MYFFCENCNLLQEDNHCLNCGKNNLREPNDDDFCCFAEIDLFFAKMFEELLENNSIKHVAFPIRKGVGIGAFSKESDAHRIFVQFKNYNRAKELYKEFLS